MKTLTKNFLLFPFNILYRLNPALELRLLFRIKHGYRLDLKNPKTYNEKLQWIKLYDKNPLMPKCVDKYHVREYIRSKGCGHLLNELIWEGFNPNDIPFDSLPNQFVIKATHGSTFNIIVKDKKEINGTEIIKKCNKWLKTKFVPCYGEWFYGKEKPRIIIEKYLENEATGQLTDYKFYCFNGKVKLIRLDNNRFTNHTADFYDIFWNKVNIKQKYPNSDIIVEKPANLDEMIKYAEILSNDFFHVRVDMYNVEGTIIFGELTFTTSAGFDKFEPVEYDKTLGDYLDIKGSVEQ